VCDEAHRIRANSNNMYTKKAERSTRTQIEELVHTARVSVFLLDDLQVVRPGEVGSTDLIRHEAERRGAELFEYELEAQFRCQGSEAFVNWIDNTLQVRRTAETIWDGSQPMEFRIVESVEELESRILQKHEDGHTARLVAGFCWPWSKDLGPDGTLLPDVRIGSWKRPWNARPEATRLARGIPKSNLWATDPKGIDQVGCVYTAQGFEFDYVGVIFGTDLRYDPETATWIGDPRASHDSQVKRAQKNFATLVKHTYRVLLTRGLKGCYVYFQDRDTAAYFRSRMENVVGAGSVVEVRPVPKSRAAEAVPAYESLSKLARVVLPALSPEPASSTVELPAELLQLVTDIGFLLTRDDLIGWPRDPEKEALLRASLGRILGGDVTSIDRVVLLARPHC
jgi:uncharacterized protein